jgi:hypothetical protein
MTLTNHALAVSTLRSDALPMSTTPVKHELSVSMTPLRFFYFFWFIADLRGMTLHNVINACSTGVSGAGTECFTNALTSLLSPLPVK